VVKQGSLKGGFFVVSQPKRPFKVKKTGIPS